MTGRQPHDLVFGQYAVAIAWLPGPAGTRWRVAKLSVEEPDAAEPARPDLWGVRVSNNPGLPGRGYSGGGVLLVTPFCREHGGSDASNGWRVWRPACLRRDTPDGTAPGDRKNS